MYPGGNIQQGDPNRTQRQAANLFHPADPEQIGISMLLRWVPVPNAVNQNFPTELAPTADIIKDVLS